ncbi:MAG: Gfo/Idh/MocA family oxidoreductase [Candidatus Margulisbacteria bacterium]|nr:Gfo/Idh/MocA family oxidoreductase [Candidatus Margulisiibacteriota bacterium]
MRKIKFALIGCGRIAGKHCEAIHQLPEAELAAVCDIRPERAKALGEKERVPYYSDYGEMLAKEKGIDVVNVLTPSGLHAEQVIDVATRFKKHIVCEKPMALTLASADKMIAACAESKVKLFIVKQNRYNLPVVKLREAVAAGRFGQLILGTVRVRWSRDQKYYDQDSWRGTWFLDGGVLTNQASHHIDLLEWLLGQPLEVSAMAATRLVNIETEDVAVATVRFANGGLGIIEATTAVRPKNLEGSISILGEKGSVEIGGLAVNEMKTWQFIDRQNEDAEVLSKYRENPPNIYGFGHVRYLADVIDCVVNDKTPPVDGREGRKSLELIVALYESAETGKTVKVGTAADHCKLGKLNGKL